MVLPLLLALTAAVTSTVSASEADNFTNRPTGAALSDPTAMRMLNHRTNEILKQVPRAVRGCDLKSLHLAIKQSLGGGEIGKLEHWAIHEARLPKVTVPWDQSIYAKTGFSTLSMGLGIMGIVPSVVLRGNFVGVDKLGHFFDQGYDYYEAIYVHHANAASVLENAGLENEDGMNGMLGNGIRSYADMAANFEGYLFWREVAGGGNPYYVCEKNRFVRTSRLFDWAQHVSPAWDEAINCNEYGRVTDSIREARPNYRCPVLPQGCEAIVERPCGFMYVTPLCWKYVKEQTPQQNCANLLKVHQDDSRACQYESGTWRNPVLRDVADLYDAAGVLWDDHKQNALDDLRSIRGPTFPF